MSLNIRHITNGKKTIYAVIHTDSGEREIYNTREEVPKAIRHYAPTGEPKHVGPDLARILGVRDVLYPDFPHCKMPGFKGANCIAESCGNCGGDYKRCKYFDKNYEI